MDCGSCLDGKVALVTGASRGIGYGIAQRFLEHGASVLITARHGDDLARARDALAAKGTIEAIVASASVPEQVEASVEACVDRLGALDVLVNNAATNPQFGPVIEAEIAAVDKVLSVNLVGVLRYCQAAWRHWMAEHGGVIINLGSVSGVQPTPMSGAYNVGKAALIHLSRQLALELGPGVRVNNLVPGLVRTRFAEVQLAADEGRLRNRHPLGRIGEPEDISGAALFLASSSSGWMTGQSVIVDGGALQTWWSDVME